MKAVILAGGEGRRLRPLTDTLPKPLMPVGGQPVMAHILRLLKQHGVSEAVVTTGYLADAIEAKFGSSFEGISLSYCRESTPLGTAGSVREAASSFTEDFFVVSGDAFCQLNLTRAAVFHRVSGALATLLLSHVPSPLEYGVVLCGSGGRVRQFVEKPSRSHAYADTVNTGVYVLSPKVLSQIPAHEFFDFGRDLFPALLREQKPIYALTDPGEWSDIGDPESYYRANMLFSDGASVFGTDCRIDNTAVIEESVLMDRVTVEKGARLSGVIVSSDCVIGEDAVLGQGCVLGEGCRIGRGVLLEAGTHLPSHTHIPDGFIQHAVSPLRSIASVEALFGENGLILPEGDCQDAWLLRIGQAIADSLPDPKIGLMTGESSQEKRMGESVLRGMAMQGARVSDLGSGFEAACACAPSALCLSLSVFLRQKNGQVFLSFFDADGLYPHRSFERSLTSALLSEPKKQEGQQEIATPVSHVDFIETGYYPLLCASFTPPSSSIGFAVEPENSPALLLRRVFRSGQASETKNLHFVLSDNGFSLAVTQGSIHLDFAHVLAVLLSAERADSIAPLALPCTAPRVLKEMAGSRARIYSHCPPDQSEDEARHLVKLRPELRDGCFAAVKLASLLTDDHALTRLCLAIPDFSLLREEIAVSPRRGYAAVLREMGRPDGDGVFIAYETGGVRILPRRNGFSLRAEAAEGEYAREMLDLSRQKLDAVLKKLGN